MRIIIMRHGDAQFYEADRILSDIGIYEANQTARKLVSQYTINKVFASPKTRALDTAKIVCEHIKGDISITTLRDLSPSGNPSVVIDYIKAICDDSDTVLLLSHIPLVENLAFYLLKNYKIEPFVTASALVIDLIDDKAQTLAFLSPNNEIMYT